MSRSTGCCQSLQTARRARSSGLHCSRNVRPSSLADHRPRPAHQSDGYRDDLGGPGIDESSPIGQAFAATTAPDITADAFMARSAPCPWSTRPGAVHVQHTQPGARCARCPGFGDAVLHEFLEETRIFRPLGMKDSGFFVPAAKRSRVASVDAPGPEGSRRPPAARRQAPPQIPRPCRWPRPTAGRWTTFARMLLNKGEVARHRRILSRLGVEMMTRDYLYGGGASASSSYSRISKEAGFGYGLQVQSRQTGYRASPGSYWWQGLTWVAWAADPKEQMIYVRFIQRMGSYGPFASDFMTALDAAVDDSSSRPMCPFARRAWQCGDLLVRSIGSVSRPRLSSRAAKLKRLATKAISNSPARRRSESCERTRLWPP